MMYARPQQCVVGWLVLLLTAVSVSARSSLPQWTKEDREKIQKGEWILGGGLFNDSPEKLKDEAKVHKQPEEVKLPELPPEPAYDPTLIPAENVPDYFISAPSGYLIDPQHLLSRQEGLDQAGFLNYHAKNSMVPVYLYIFDAQQKIPEPYGLDKLVADRFRQDRPVCVVFYFLGDPSRSQIRIGGSYKADTAFLRKTRDSTRVKAMEKSEPADQLESFLIELSISLYWLEKDWQESMAKAKAKHAAPSAEHASSAGEMKKPTFWEQLRPDLPYVIIVLTGFGTALAACVWLIWIWKKSRRFVFPLIDVPSRLGADYGAGVGAVLAFRSGTGAPSSQREQVPDYMLHQ